VLLRMTSGADQRGLVTCRGNQPDQEQKLDVNWLARAAPQGIHIKDLR
jgi:hypothetical protein